MGSGEEWANDDGKGPWGCFLVLAPVAAFLLMLMQSGKRRG